LALVVAVLALMRGRPGHREPEAASLDARTTPPGTSEAQAVSGSGNQELRQRVVMPDPAEMPLDCCISGVVLAPDGSPLEGARCLVGSARRPSGFGDELERPAESRKTVATGTSGPDGSFRIEVPEGTWELSVQAHGCSPWFEQDLRRGDYRIVRMRPERQQWIEVRDESAAPVSDAEIRQMLGKWEDPDRRPPQATTGGAGRALLTEIPTWLGWIHVRHADFVPAIAKLPEIGGESPLVVTLTHGVRIFGTITVLGNPPTSPATVRFETFDPSFHEVEADPSGAYSSRVSFAPGATLEVAALVKGFGESRREIDLGAASETGELRVDIDVDSSDRTVLGRVVDATTTTPIEGCEVHLEPLVSLPPLTPIPLTYENFSSGFDFQASDPKESPAARFRLGAVSNGSGRFEVRGLHPRKAYKLLLFSEKHANAVLWVPQSEPDSVLDLGTIRMKEAGRIWGRVVTPDGLPIVGERVSTATWPHIDLTGQSEFVPQRPDTERRGLTAYTREDGTFSIAPYPQGEFHLSCLGKRFGPFTVPPGGPLELVTDNIHVRQQERRVLLTVLDDTHQPVPKAYAQMRRVRKDSEDPSESRWDPWDWDLGEASGSIELGAPTEGTYSIHVIDLEGQLADQTILLEVTEKLIRHEVVLFPDPAPAGRLEGLVVAPSGEPVSGAQVTVIPDTGELVCNCLQPFVSTDETGYFTFGTFMKGNHRLVVKDPTGALPATYYWPARPGESVLITME
jgi:hypothetical protein